MNPYTTARPLPVVAIPIGLPPTPSCRCPYYYLFNMSCLPTWLYFLDCWSWNVGSCLPSDTV